MDFGRIILRPMAVVLLASSLAGCHFCTPCPDMLWQDYCWSGGMCGSFNRFGGSCRASRCVGNCPTGDCRCAAQTTVPQRPIPTPQPLEFETTDDDAALIRPDPSPTIVEEAIPFDASEPMDLPRAEHSPIVPVVPRNVIPQHLDR
jgi:hypothetical protein